MKVNSGGVLVVVCNYAASCAVALVVQQRFSASMHIRWPTEQSHMQLSSGPSTPHAHKGTIKVLLQALLPKVDPNSKDERGCAFSLHAWVCVVSV